MKKIVGIVIALLTLCLIFALPTFAEEAATPTPGIAAASLSFDGGVHMYFDVYFGETEPTTTEYGVIFWTEEQTEYTYEKAIGNAAAEIVMGAKATSVSYDEHPCYEFTYSVAAECMTDMVYVQGFMKNGESYDLSTVIPYSVQTYAGNKLGIYPNANPDNVNTDAYFVDMVEKLLNLGKWSQLYFDYRTDDLADSILHWSKGLEYAKNADGTCYVSGIGTCTDTDLYIPKVALDGECKGLTVTGVGKCAFDSTFQLKSVTIPNTVTSIGESAFVTCSGVTKITIPDSVTSIGWRALGACTDITEITIPEGVTLIDGYVFDLCYKLASVTIPHSVTEIEDGAFADCKALETITFKGTMAEWESITKDSDWNKNTPAYTIYCTDGEITK